jgi:hypothetical protein
LKYVYDNIWITYVIILYFQGNEEPHDGILILDVS